MNNFSDHLTPNKDFLPEPRPPRRWDHFLFDKTSFPFPAHATSTKILSLPFGRREEDGEERGEAAARGEGGPIGSGRVYYGICGRG